MRRMLRKNVNRFTKQEKYSGYRRADRRKGGRQGRGLRDTTVTGETGGDRKCVPPLNPLKPGRSRRGPFCNHAPGASFSSGLKRSQSRDKSMKAATSYPPISSRTTKRPTFQSEGTGASAVTVPSAWSRPRRSYRNKAREAGRGQQWPCETEDPAAERGLEDRYPIRALPNSLTEASTVPKKETECPRSAPKRSDHEGSFHRNVYLLLASRVHS